MFSFQTTLDELPPAEVSGLAKAKADATRLTEAIDLLINPPPATNTEAEACLSR